MTIKQLVTDKTPFAVIQYFESLNLRGKETFKRYELLTVNEKQKNNISYKIIDDNDIRYLKKNLNLFDIKHKTEDGTVYEFMGFKKIIDELKTS